jgi:hypothetical protein
MEPLLEQFSSHLGELTQGVVTTIGVLRIVGHTLSVIFILGIIFCIIKLLMTREERNTSFENHVASGVSQQKVVNPRTEHWAKVSEAMASPNEQLWRSALIDADTMLEEVVNAMGYQGETFGEKLKQINRADVPWLDAAWDVHRLRNILAHEGSRYHLTQREAYRAYKVYESILYETGYLS